MRHIYAVIRRLRRLTVPWQRYELQRIAEHQERLGQYWESKNCPMSAADWFAKAKRTRERLEVINNRSETP